MHFDLVNPADNGGHPRAPAAEGAVECGAWDAPITRQAMDLSDATLLAVAGSAAPLFVHQPEVTLAEVAAHAPFPGVPNQVASRPPRRAPAPRTKWTRRVPHPVLIGHAASLAPY